MLLKNMSHPKLSKELKTTYDEFFAEIDSATTACGKLRYRSD